MPTIGSITRTVRFNPEDLGKIESLMKKEDTSFNNAVHLLINDTGTPQKNEKSSLGTPQKTIEVYTPNKNIPKSDYESLAEMANLMRVSTDKLLSDFKDMIENGDLYYSGGKLRNPTYEEFENICESRGQKVENILTKVIRNM